MTALQPSLPGPNPAPHQRPSDLKEACLQAAREVISEQGVEDLSMRDVSRKLHISHQAPYRHFASRDHLLAEIMRRCFVDFARHLDASSQLAERSAIGPGTSPLAAMGMAYMAYAAAKPLEYRLMFGTPWPEPASHPELVKHAVHAFDILRNHLRQQHGTASAQIERADLDALFIWSTLHGLASIMQANVLPHLALSERVMASAQTHVMQHMGLALAASGVEVPT
jgi:AcrR family transcriptional regulator